MNSIESIFSPQGELAVALDNFAPRHSQTSMARAIESAIQLRKTALIEAGTGTGKTFAYLVPALLDGGKVIVSTGTKQLQDQLFSKDLILLKKALQVNVNAVLLKGRANYLCVYRLKKSLTQSSNIPDQFIKLKKIEAWSKVTFSGDKSEFTDLSDTDPLWLKATSTVDNCLGQECSDYNQCHVVKARRMAQEADVVVINHHLFCADLALRETGFAELLPQADVIILDEAHQLPDIMTRFFGESLSQRQLMDFIQEMNLSLAQEAPDMPEVIAGTRQLSSIVARFRLSFGTRPQVSGWSEWIRKADVADSLESLIDVFSSKVGVLQDIAERSVAIETLVTRLNWIVQHLQRMKEQKEDAIYWFETTAKGFQLHITPVDIAPVFLQHQQRFKASWIFTSATLAVNNDFSFFANKLGLNEAEKLAWDSPFDYPKNAQLYLPDLRSEPNDHEFVDELVRATVPLVNDNPGGTFYLFTSYRNLNKAAELLPNLTQREILVQGDMPRRELLQRFRQCENAILLGTSSFWEGVDVRGKALSCVIIDKLPFPSPGDPVLDARWSLMRKQGLNPFMHYSLPHAVMTLKQGVGRLIRDVDDRGLLVIGDKRIKTKGYGKEFLKSLPEIPVTDSQFKARAFINGLKT